MQRCAFALLLGLSAWLMTPACLAQDSLERGLLKHAPNLIKHFKDNDYKNVGVLKFLVSREGKPFTDNAGTLNLLAARRLELALILANDPRTPIGIIDNASEVARKIPGASHLSQDGRKKLFTSQYPLAWGKDKVDPDAFVTGTTAISADLRKLTLTLYCFDRKTNKLMPVSEDFQVANATDRLSEMGESFVLRSAFDESKGEDAVAKNQAKVFDDAIKVHAQKIKHPAQQDDVPVTLEVYYDGKKVPLEFRDGMAFIPEPREGQAVEFGLQPRRQQNSLWRGLESQRREHAGKGTLARLELPKMGPRSRLRTVGDRAASRSATCSRSSVSPRLRNRNRHEMNYGRDVGTITMTVFREQKGKVGPKLPLEDDELIQTVVQKLAELPARPEQLSWPSRPSSWKTPIAA